MYVAVTYCKFIYYLVFSEASNDFTLNKLLWSMTCHLIGLEASIIPLLNIEHIQL